MVDKNDRCEIKNETGDLNAIFKIKNDREIQSSIMNIIKKNTVETSQDSEDGEGVDRSFGLNLQGAILEVLKNKSEKERELIYTGFMLEKKLTSLMDLMKQEYMKEKIKELMGEEKFNIFGK